MNLDDLKVTIASAGGLGNWLVDMDILIKLLISLVSLVYITLKVKQLLDKPKKK